MASPILTEQHRKLEALVGRWTGLECVAGVGQTTSRLVARIDLDGFYLTTNYEQEVDGSVVFRGHGVYGWSVVKQHYTMNWFDTTGETAPAFGHWRDNRLVFDNHREQDRSRYTYTVVRHDSYTLHIEHSQDGATWTTFLEGTYTRVPQ